MSVLPIQMWPDGCLMETCSRVEPGDDVGQLAQDMLETMYNAPGRGLAAPQVGVLKRMFVLDCGWKEGAPRPIVCINPEIISFSEETVSGPEQCLSIPNVPIQVTRPARIFMRWRDLNNTIQARSFEGAEAKCAQHEMDHLDGKVVFDHLTDEQRRHIENDYLGGAQRERA